MSLLRRHTLLGLSTGIYPQTTTDQGIVLAARGTGDEISINDPCVISIDANTWGMIYTARSATKREGLKLATSPKGQVPVWTKYNADGSYILQSGGGGAFDAEIVDSCVINVSGTFYVIYSTATGMVGLATGAALTSLSKSGSNPIINNTALSTFDKYIRHVQVIEKSGTYYLFYEGRINTPFLIPGKIGYSTSNDLTTWSRVATPIFDPDNYPNSFSKSTIAIQLVEINGKYFIYDNGCWYNTGGTQAIASSGILLKSNNLTTWTLVNSIIPYDNNLMIGAGLAPTGALINDITGKYNVYGKNDIYGNIVKFNVNFNGDIPNSLYEDTFDGTTLDFTNVWDSKTADSNGITISQNDAIILTADGSQTASAHSLIGKSGKILTTRNLIVCQFDWSCSSANGGVSVVYFKGTNDNTETIILGVRRVNASGGLNVYWNINGTISNTDKLAISYNNKFKLIFEYVNAQVLLSWWYWDGSAWAYIHHVLDGSLTDVNFDWHFELYQTNLLGSAITQNFDNALITNFNSNKENPYV